MRRRNVVLSAAMVSCGSTLLAVSQVLAEPQPLGPPEVCENSYEDQFGGSGGNFGWCMAMSGDKAIVGSPGGSEFVFRNIGGNWQQVAHLEPSVAGGWYGGSVSLSGDTAIVGARADANDQGAAYIYREIGGVWQEVVKLTVPNTEFLGRSVALEGNTAVIAAQDEQQDDEVVDGVVYIYREIGGVWQQIAELRSDEPGPQPQFGQKVAINGNTIVVGDPRYDYEGLIDVGAAYVFHEVGGTWYQAARLTAADAVPGALLGEGAAISDDTVVVGASRDLHGDIRAGSVYVFRRLDGLWQQIAKLTPTYLNSATNFLDYGLDVAISGPTIVVGAHEDSEQVLDGGAAYLYRENAGNWDLLVKYLAPGTTNYQYFGTSVAVEGYTTVIGARGLTGSPDRAYSYNVQCEQDGDCNSNTIADGLELVGNDCNFDDILDECQLAEGDCNSSSILDACEAHAELLQARSCRQHGAAGEFCISIDAVETRAPGQLLLEFDLDGVACDVDALALVHCADQGYTAVATAFQVDSDSVRLAMNPALPQPACCEITFYGGLEGTWQVRTLAGDVDLNEVVNGADISIIKPHFGEVTSSGNFLLDVDANGFINGADITAIKPLLGHVAATCP